MQEALNKSWRSDQTIEDSEVKANPGNESKDLHEGDKFHIYNDFQNSVKANFNKTISGSLYQCHSRFCRVNDINGD